MRNLSYENEFRLQVHFNANQTHFHMKDFARRLVLKQRHKETRKWLLKELVHALRAYIELWMNARSLGTREKVLEFHDARPRVALAF